MASTTGIKQRIVEKLLAWGPAVATGYVAGRALETGRGAMLVMATSGLCYAVVTLRAPIVGLVLWLLAAPFVSPFARLSLPGPDITFTRVAVALLILAVGLGASLRRRALRRIEPVEWVMAGFCLVVYVDLAFRSRTPGEDALTMMDEFVLPFLLYSISKNLVHDEADLDRLLRAFAGLGVLLVLYAGAQAAGLVGAGEQSIEAAFHAGEGRATGPFVNSVEFGGVVAIVFFATSLLAVHRGRGRMRLALAVLLVLLAGAVVASLTRSVWLGFALAFLVFGVLLRFWTATAALGLASAGALVLVTFIAIGSTLDTPEPSEDARESIGERVVAAGPIHIRLVMYRAALSLSLERPFLGYGRGEERFQAERRRHLKSVGDIPAEMGLMAGPLHNVYLFTLVQWGGIGLALYLAIFWLLVRDGWRLRSRLARHRSVRFGYTGFFIAASIVYLMQGLFMDVPALPFLSSIYFIAAGGISALAAMPVDAPARDAAAAERPG